MFQPFGDLLADGIKCCHDPRVYYDGSSAATVHNYTHHVELPSTYEDDTTCPRKSRRECDGIMACQRFPVENPPSQSNGQAARARAWTVLTELGYHILHGGMVDYPGYSGHGTIADYTDQR